MSSNRMTQPWAVRRLIYGILALIGAVLFGFGIADAAQIDQWTEAAERLLTPLLLTLTSGLAGVKANPGSDMKHPVPAEELPDTTPAQRPSTGNQLLDELRERIAQNRR